MAMDSKHRLPLHQRLFLSLFIFFFLFLVLFLTFQVRREKKFQMEFLHQQMQVYNQFCALLLREGVSYPDAARAVVPKDTQDLFFQMRITVMDPAGKVLYDTEGDVEQMSNHLDRPEVKQALTKGKGFTQFRHSKEVSRPYLYAARSYPEFVVRTAIPYSFTWPSLLWSDRHFIFFVLLVSLGFCFAIYFFTQRLGKNVEQLQDLATRLQAGEDLSDMPAFEEDELGSISNQLVQVYQELEETREQQALIKRQMTQNINHELKTPVTVIQGYLETLHQHPDLPPDKMREFMEKCYTQANRLSRLMQDVATITRMNEGEHLFDKERLSLNTIIEEVFSDMEHRMKELQFGLHLDIPVGMTLTGNASLVDSIFRNLVDNALAYSGGSRITVSAVPCTGANGQTGYRFVFKDNGVGIPEEHMPRIFERFYRIDKGRSRKMGGTGLGLSIVRNAVMIHFGEIRVGRSVLGGAEFTFTLMNP